MGDEQVKKAQEEGIKEIRDKIIELKAEEIRRKSELNKSAVPRRNEPPGHLLVFPAERVYTC